MTPQISVIVPVYNVERYLDDCVNSILCQTFQDFEILLVDDGSTDSSGILCDEWAAKDKRISVIHKANGGLSYARNAGTVKAQGQYICFLDSDDFIAKDWLENLHTSIESSGADIAKGGIFYVKDSAELNPFSDNIEAYHTISFKKEETISSYEYLRRLINYEGYRCVTNHIIKAELCKNCPFPEGRTNEDHRVYFSYIKNSGKIFMGSFCGLYYRQRTGSITNSYNPRFIANMVEDYVCHHNILAGEYSDTESAKTALVRATELFFFHLASAQHTELIKSSLTKETWKTLYPATKKHNMKQLLPKVLYLQYKIYSISDNLYYLLMRIKKAVSK